MPRYVDMSGWDSFMNDMLDSRNMYDQYDIGYTDAMDRVDDWLDAQPTIDPESLGLHSRWEYDQIRGIATCQNCGFERNVDDNFGRAISCPNCGAKTDEEEGNGQE